MIAPEPAPRMPQQSVRIVIAGAAHIDRTGWLEAPTALGCSNPGRFDESPGGTAFNIARVLAALKARPELVSLVGEDLAVIWLKSEMKSCGIKVHLDGQSKANTGTYTSIIEPDGSLLVALADMAIYSDFSAAEAIPLVDTLTNSDCLCVDTNLHSKEVGQLLAASKAKKIGLSISKAKAPRLLEYASGLDLLFTNRMEASALLGLEASNPSSIEAVAAGLRELGLNMAVKSATSRKTSPLWTDTR